MKTITRIVIRRYIGYFDDPKFSCNKVTVTENSIAYEYVPQIEFQTEAEAHSGMVKWSYKTNNPIFQMTYAEIVQMIPAILAKKLDIRAMDVGPIEFSITYSDKTRVRRTFEIDGDYFKDLFALIKRLVPMMEQVPEVLLTSDDYDDEEEEQEVNIVMGDLEN